MLTVYHIQVSGLDQAALVALTMPGPNAERATFVAELRKAGKYLPVATIDRDDPTVTACEVAYTLTQNIDQSWSLTPPVGLTVLPIAGEQRLGAMIRDRHVYGRRSTMMGDIIEFSVQHNGECKTTHRFVVDTVGFAEVPLS